MNEYRSTSKMSTITLFYFFSRKVRLEVKNELEKRNITNIMGIIEGKEEPGLWKKYFFLKCSALFMRMIM